MKLKDKRTPAQKRKALERASRKFGDFDGKRAEALKGMRAEAERDA